MPWSDYPTVLRQFSGLIQSAANERFGAAATVQIISEAAKAAGIALQFADFSSISKLYGDYVGVRTSGERLDEVQQQVARTGIDQGITAGHISQPPWAPDPRSWGQNPYVLVTGSYSLDTPSGTVQGFFSHQYRLEELHTIGQVTADLQAQLDLSPGETNLQGAQLDGITSITWSAP